MDGSTGRVGRQRVHAHGLVDNTLAGKGSVTVHEHTHGLVEGADVMLHVLDSSGLTQDNGVLSLKM